jgi:starch phosphorylase
MDPKSIGVEFLFANKKESEQDQRFVVHNMALERTVGTISFFTADIIPSKAGIINYGIRIYPKNEDLPHRQDFPLLMWI